MTEQPVNKTYNQVTVWRILMNNYVSAQVKTHSDSTGHALATRTSTAQTPGRT
jgi:hypothetical protein